VGVCVRTIHMYEQETKQERNAREAKEPRLANHQGKRCGAFWTCRHADLDGACVGCYISKSNMVL